MANPQDPYGDFPPLGIDQPGAGQGIPGYDPYDGGGGPDPYHFYSGVDQQWENPNNSNGNGVTPNDTNSGWPISGMPDGGNQGAGPWYDPSGGSNSSPGGGILSKLKDILSGGKGQNAGLPAAAGLMALGKMLESLFSKPLFQPKQSLIGNAGDFKNQLDSFRHDTEAKRANNPVNSTPEAQDVRKWLTMASGGQ